MSDEYGFYPGGPGGVPVASGSPYANPLDAATGYDPASLNPPGRAQLGGRGPQLPPFMRTNIWPPQLLLSTNSQVAHATRTYTTGILNQAQNVQSQVVIQFDIPCIVFGMSAACINTAAPAFGVLGGANLDTFTANLEHTNGDRLVTQPVLGSCIFGNSRRAFSGRRKRLGIRPREQPHRSGDSSGQRDPNVSISHFSPSKSAARET